MHHIASCKDTTDNRYSVQNWLTRSSFCQLAGSDNEITILTFACKYHACALATRVCEVAYRTVQGLQTRFSKKRMQIWGQAQCNE